MLQHRIYSSVSEQNAKLLRRNMTPQERRLWYGFLRDYRPKFQRQRVIGKYVVDFYCAKATLVIELDGCHHYEEEKYGYDEARTNFLQRRGLRMLRFLNHDIDRNFSSVCEMIDRAVKGINIEGRINSW